MNPRDIPAALTDIGTEARRLLQGHGHTYDVIVRYTDGTIDVSNSLRYLPQRDAHMKRVCEWLTRTGRDAGIEVIELITWIPAGTLVYLYKPRQCGRHSVAVRP
jgi:hypothetical protein